MRMSRESTRGDRSRSPMRPPVRHPPRLLRGLIHRLKRVQRPRPIRHYLTAV